MEENKYIEELKKCVEDNSKINEVLGKTSELKKYLSQMGMSEEFTESASTVEIIRNRLKSILLTEECEISDSGIYHKDGRFGVNDDGSVMISNNDGFRLSDKPGKIEYQRKFSVTSQGITIDSFGAVESFWEHGLPPYSGDYSSIKRNHEKNTIIVESTDGASYEKTTEKPDNGNPITLSTTEDFEKEYIRLVQEFPKIKGWYDTKYPGIDGDGKKFEQIRKGISDSLLQEDINSLSMEIDTYIGLIGEEKDKQENASKKYEDIVSTISEIGDRSEVGKLVSNSLMKKVNQNPLRSINAEAEEEPKEDSEEAKTENKEETKKELEERLEQLKNRLKEEKGNTSRIYSSINKLEEQIKKVPVIGKKIITKAQKPSLDDEVK